MNHWSYQVSQLKIGDVVMLKSGSPAMTISNIDTKDNEVTVKFWNSQKSEVNSNVLNIQTIKAYEDPLLKF
jgi:uncharacterized protein YodC (DUF2158 family)